MHGRLCDAALPPPLLVEERELPRGDLLGEQPVEGPEEPVMRVSLQRGEVVLSWQEGQVVEEGVQR
jgi:hypothetical protein